MLPLLAALLLSCVPTSGGWDARELDARFPQLASNPHRLGDLVPFPAIVGDRLVLVACRFDERRPVAVRGSGPGWPQDWARTAVDALDRSLPALRVEVARAERGRDPKEGVGVHSGPSSADVLPGMSAFTGPSIEVRSIDDPAAEGPRGLGDTLTECDVSSENRGPTPVRGRIVRSEIRLRRRATRITGRVQAASREEWTAAFLHELGHALGFAGHARTGPSLVHREQGELRSLGREAIAEGTVPTPNLRALYALPAGLVLGEAPLEASSRVELEAVLAEVRSRNARLGAAAGPFSTTGDREARMIWRWPGGLVLAIRFPEWRHGLRSSSPITLRREGRR